MTTNDFASHTPTAGPAAEAAPAETARVTGDVLVSKVKELLHEGTVRRIVVKNDEGHTVMEIPVTAGLVAVVALPIVTAIGAIAALANDWTIQVYRQEAE
jgi:hypothetical protein